MRGPPETVAADKRLNEEEVDPPGPVAPDPPHEEEGDVLVREEDLLEEYGWMENEEEFDQQVLEDIEQEDFLEECFEEMWLEEDQMWVHYNPDAAGRNGHAGAGEVEGNIEKLTVTDDHPDEAQHPPGDSDDDIPRSVSQS